MVYTILQGNGSGLGRNWILSCIYFNIILRKGVLYNGSTEKEIQKKRKLCKKEVVIEIKAFVKRF